MVGFGTGFFQFLLYQLHQYTNQNIIICLWCDSGFSQMPHNVSQLIYLERAQKQKHFGTSFFKIGIAVAELWVFEGTDYMPF